MLSQLTNIQYKICEGDQQPPQRLQFKRFSSAGISSYWPYDMSNFYFPLTQSKLNVDDGSIEFVWKYKGDHRQINHSILTTISLKHLKQLTQLKQHENLCIPNFFRYRMHQCCAIGTKRKYARSHFGLFLNVLTRSSDHEIYH